MENSLEVKNLTKRYGRARGIENVTIEIAKGMVYGFIGPNGAGKSTTIKCIMNLINKTEGEIYIDHTRITKNTNQVKQKIGYLPSEIHLYEDLTVKKMLEYSASFYQKDCTKKIQELVEKLEVDVHKKIDELSLGNLKKVGIILALMHDPEIIIMDEATSGLDPLMQEAFYEILEEEKQKGKTIFFSSHILSEIKRICDKVAIIKEGKIIEVDNLLDLNNSEFVKVKIQADEIEKIIHELNIEILEQKENQIKFIYREDLNVLLKRLTNYKISRLLIEEPDIEDIFMHYYK